MKAIKKLYTASKVETVTIDEFDLLAKEGKSQQFSVYMNVDPLLAAHILGNRNKNNRSISKPMLEKYTRDMQNGLWKLNQIDINAIDKNGNLADGQHRLHAIVNSGKTIPINFVFGVSEEYKEIQGKGRSKTYADTLSIKGMDKYASDVAASVNLMYAFTKNPSKPLNHIKNHVPSDSEKMRFHKINLATIQNSFEYVIGCGIKANNRIITASTAATLHWIFSQSTLGKKKADEFMEKLINGDELKKTDSIMVVRNRIINNPALSEQKNRDDLMGLIVLAYNDWTAGKDWTTAKKTPIGKGMPHVRGLKKVAGVDVYA